jgi:uncharacterized surface protein with fasciclin (FAS1) repeats
MKNKVKDSILLTVCDLPKEDIKNMGLSYRDIGIRVNKIIKQYSINNLKNDKYLIDNQKKLRRDLSNWVNDPKNLVNSQGNYIGDKFGARITICLSDGTVIHDVRTFCRDIKNKNNRILGEIAGNNHYIFIKNEPVSLDASNKQFLYSTFNLNNLTDNIKYENVYAYKVKSSNLPSSNPSSDLVYSRHDTNDGDILNIVSGELMDLHTTRKEYIQATIRRYGYNSRVTESLVTTDHHVCKYVENIQGANVYCRLTYFDFPPPTIIDVAAGDGRFKTLVAAVKAAGLVKTLSSPGPFTVFAPTDDAFKKFTPDALEALLADVPQLKKILQYHVVDGKVMAADVVKLSFAKTLADGLNVSIRVENGKVFVNDSQVIITNIPCANGVIHVIDTVLSKKTTYDLLVGSNKFNTLISVLGAVDLDVVLSGAGPFTIFAPTDAAFTKLPDGTVDNLAQLQKLLNYHAVADKVMAADIINAIADRSGTTYMTTLAEQSISVSMKNGDVILNDSAKVTITDVLGSNDGGVVVHVIDTVLSFQTIYQLLKAHKHFERWIELLDAAALAPTLSDLSPLTLFAPGNDAFANIPSDLLTNLVLPENLVELRELVRNNLCPGQIKLEDDSYLEMSSHLTAYLDKNGGDWFINGVKLVDQNKPIAALNGVIYPVVEILKPLSVLEMVSTIDSLNKFYDLVDRLPNNSQANVALGANNITLLAPVNGAINLWLNGREILNLQVEQVETIVKEHIILGQDSLEKDDLEAFASTNTRVRNLFGRELKFTKTSAGDLKVDGNKFKNYDIKCKNGIIHITDNALGGFWP